jgi:hypothetical protein
VANDFGLFLETQLPALGSASEGLRFTSESWTANGRDAVFNLSGLPGHTYKIGIWNANRISKVEGAKIETENGQPRLNVSFPGDSGQGYVHQAITIHFSR